MASAPGTAAVLDPLQRRERLLVALVAAGVWLGARLYAPWVEHGPPLCPLRLAVGLPCPGCGLTRAFCSLVQADWQAALSANLLCLPLALLLSVAPVVALWELARGRAGAWYRPLLFSPVFARGLGLAVAAFQVARCAAWLADGTLARDYFPASLAGLLYRRLTG